MFSKEQYEKGIRCRGMCNFCTDNSCYQGFLYKTTPTEVSNSTTTSYSIINKLKEEIEQLKADLIDKDNEISILNHRLNYLQQSKQEYDFSIDKYDTNPSHTHIIDIPK